MEIINLKLSRITEFWNDFAWNYKIIQDRILWDEGVKTNYYGDILRYFEDTSNIIIKKPVEGNFEESIFYATGFLQIIYVQQDLTDELLQIFKIVKSDKEDKNPNRDIRNELIGHPISKDRNGRFRSSVFLGGKLSVNNIHYIKYSKESNFLGLEKSFKTTDIIESHKDFLNKYFDKILEKIKTILKDFSIKIQELKCEISSDDFIVLVDLTSEIFEDIFKSNYLYNEKILKECYRRKDEHVRYNLVIKNFKKDLLKRLDDTLENIQILCLEITDPNVETKFIAPKIKINFGSNKKIKANKSNHKKDYHYEIQKLFAKHPIFGVSYFKEEFNSDEEILNELCNMEKNIDNDLEYYSSFFFIKTLISNRIEKVAL